MSAEPQIMRSPAGERVVGKVYTAEELATLLNKQADVLRGCEGGVTFSGGEPLMQVLFVCEVIDLLDNLHVVLDTTGYAKEADFRLVAGKCDLVYYDLKLVDKEAHLYYTGVDNGPILSNLRVLGSMGIPFVVRVPLIPGVTDAKENLALIADTLRGLAGLVRVDLLPYNKAAGGKYKGLGMDYRPAFDEGLEVNIDTEPFVSADIPVNVEGVDMAALKSKLVSCNQSAE
jgi:pyruvate formate lyase activating enzyme